MSKISIVCFICIIASLSLQAAEKSLEERLAEAKRNSAIAEKKASAFQENFGKDERPLLFRGKKATKAYETINLTRVDVVEIHKKRRYCDINIDLETTASKDDILELLLDSIVALDLPMDKGFYMYRGEEDLSKKLLAHLKKKIDIKSIQIKKLLLQ